MCALSNRQKLVGSIWAERRKREGRRWRRLLLLLLLQGWRDTASQGWHFGARGVPMPIHPVATTRRTILSCTDHDDSLYCKKKQNKKKTTTARCVLWSALQFSISQFYFSPSLLLHLTFVWCFCRELEKKGLCCLELLSTCFHRGCDWSKQFLIVLKALNKLFSKTDRNVKKVYI